jgi:FKBP-type peptidyl-prolyl cis-trans isomerase
MIALLVMTASAAGILNVIPDGRVTKEIIHSGPEGAKPLLDQRVEIRYVGWLPDGRPFSSTNPGETFTFVVGRGVIPGWSLAVQTMNVGEKAKVTIDYAYGYGERGYPPVVPARTQLTFEIELVKILSS